MAVLMSEADTQSALTVSGSLGLGGVLGAIGCAVAGLHRELSSVTAKERGLLAHKAQRSGGGELRGESTLYTWRPSDMQRQMIEDIRRWTELETNSHVVRYAIAKAARELPKI